jgi:hypothetical protein
MGCGDGNRPSGGGVVGMDAQIGIAAIAFRFKTAASARFFARRGSGHRLPAIPIKIAIHRNEFSFFAGVIEISIRRTTL